jgi:hypothetical protein
MRLSLEGKKIPAHMTRAIVTAQKKVNSTAKNPIFMVIKSSVVYTFVVAKYVNNYC